MESAIVEKRKPGRWKETNNTYQPEIGTEALKRKWKAARSGRPFLSQLTVETEIRICLRYLTDSDYRLTRIAQDIRTRPANVRALLAAYGIDVQSRVLTSEI